jgi:hypothetical protein
LNADPFAERSIVAAFPMLAQQFDRTLIRRCQAFEYLDGGRFAGAVWTKQSKTLARKHFEIEPVNGRHVCKSLHQT